MGFDFWPTHCFLHSKSLVYLFLYIGHPLRLPYFTFKPLKTPWARKNEQWRYEGNKGYVMMACYTDTIPISIHATNLKSYILPKYANYLWAKLKKQNLFTFIVFIHDQHHKLYIISYFVSKHHWVFTKRVIYQSE